MAIVYYKCDICKQILVTFQEVNEKVYWCPFCRAAAPKRLLIPVKFANPPLQSFLLPEKDDNDK